MPCITYLPSDSWCSLLRGMRTVGRLVVHRHVAPTLCVSDPKLCGALWEQLELAPKGWRWLKKEAGECSQCAPTRPQQAHLPSAAGSLFPTAWRPPEPSNTVLLAMHLAFLRTRCTDRGPGDVKSTCSRFCLCVSFALNQVSLDTYCLSARVQGWGTVNGNSTNLE